MVLSSEAQVLILKCYSSVLDCTSTEVQALEAIIPYVKKYRLTNGMFILNKIITNLVSINNSISRPITLTENALTEAFNAYAPMLLRQSYALELTDLTDEILILDIPEQAQKATDLIYKDLMELYDLMTTEYPSSIGELSPNLLAFKEVLLSDIASEYIRLQASCLTEDVYINKKLYRGSRGVSDISALMKSELDDIIASELQIDFVSSLDEEIAIAGNNTYEFLGNTSIPPIDALGGITTNNIIVITAYEKVGKTKFLSFLTDMLRTQNVLCSFYAGETPAVKIINSIKSHTFKRVHGKIVTWQEVHKPVIIEDKSLATEVSIFQNAYYEQYGKISILEHLTLADFKNRIRRLYAAGVTVFMLDNVDSLPIGNMKLNVGSGSVSETKTKLDKLIQFMVELKKELPITFIVSNWSKEEGEAENSRSSTGTSKLSQYADCVMNMYMIPGVADSIRGLQITKWRENKIVQPKMALDTQLACCHFYYEDSIQYLLDGSMRGEF